MIVRPKNNILQDFLQNNKEFLLLQRVLEQHNQSFYIVGGAVRNSIIKEKLSDIDISSSFLPLENKKILEKNNIKVLTHGIDFGTIVAVINNKSFEITSFRKDFKQTGRYTKVLYTKNMQEDALRRDFTYNALYYCPKDNTIYDFFNGIDHINKRQTIFIGNASQRIREDFLRILRYFRFESTYGNGFFDENIVKICQEENKGLKILSKERISQELLKIFGSKHVTKALFTLSDNNILKHVLKLDFCQNKQEDLQNILNCFKANNISFNKSLVTMVFLELSQSFKAQDIIIKNTIIKDIKATVEIFNKLEKINKEEILIMLEKQERANIINALVLKAHYTQNDFFLKIIKDLPLKLSFPFNGSIFKSKIKNKNMQKAIYELKISYLKGGNTEKTTQDIINRYKD